MRHSQCCRLLGQVLEGLNQRLAAWTRAAGEGNCVVASGVVAVGCSGVGGAERDGSWSAPGGKKGDQTVRTFVPREKGRCWLIGAKTPESLINSKRHASRQPRRNLIWKYNLIGSRTVPSCAVPCRLTRFPAARDPGCRPNFFWFLRMCSAQKEMALRRDLVLPTFPAFRSKLQQSAPPSSSVIWRPVRPSPVLPLSLGPGSHKRCHCCDSAIITARLVYEHSRVLWGTALAADVRDREVHSMLQVHLFEASSLFSSLSPFFSLFFPSRYLCLLQDQPLSISSACRGPHSTWLPSYTRTGRTTATALPVRRGMIGRRPTPGLQPLRSGSKSTPRTHPLDPSPANLATGQTTHSLNVFLFSFPSFVLLCSPSLGHDMPPCRQSHPFCLFP